MSRRVDPSAARCLPEVLRGHLERHAQEPLFTLLEDGETEAGSLTFADLDRRARAVAAELRARRLAGERVLLVFPTSLSFLTAFFGCLYAGAVAVPVAVPARREQKPSHERLVAIARDCRPRLALTTAALAPRLGKWAAGIQELAGLPWTSPDEVDAARAETWRDPGLERGTLAFLQYTSGSTAAPRGVMVSHGNILHNAEMIKVASRHEPRAPGVSWLPVHHDMGLVGMVLERVYAAMPTVLIPPLYFLQSPVRWLRAISRYRAHTSGGPDFAYDLCVRKIDEEDCEGLDLSSWRVAFNGAEPVRARTAESFVAKFRPFGLRPEALFPCYGLAEATLLVSGGPADDRPVIASFDRRALQQGKVIPAAPAGDGETHRLVGSGRLGLAQEVRIVDPATRTCCATEQIGEIWIAGDNVGRGYWCRPEDEAFNVRLADDPDAGPYLRTGDLGFLREGELFVTGRLKDLIIIAGENHYPQDIERTVEHSHSKVRAGGCAAFSIEHGGAERLVVVAEVDAGRPPAEMVTAIRRAVSDEHALRLHAIELIRPAALPKTTSGKVRRHLCRELFLRGELACVPLSEGSERGPA